jgi:hypothetical protein|tara:strand:- start:899 stop:1135 length:237 start_codon:yes stop_codon:yes gene_type:complete
MLKCTLVGHIIICAIDETVIKTTIGNLANCAYCYHTATGSKRAACLLSVSVVAAAILPGPQQSYAQKVIIKTSQAISK